MQENEKIIHLTSITEDQYTMVQDLVGECVRTDGASACFQSEFTLNWNKEMPCWFLYFQTKQEEKSILMAALSVFAPQQEESELSVYVHPAVRCQGVATKLISKAIEVLSGFGSPRYLLVCDNASASGMAFIAKKGLALHHSEYSLTFDKAKAITPIPSRMVTRKATKDDFEPLVGLIKDAFGEERSQVEIFVRSSMESPNRDVFVGLFNDILVATASVGYDSKEVASINMVAVSRAMQGRGLGMEIIQSLIGPLVARQLDIVIEVFSTNMRAYGLYKKIGFTETRVVNYYTYE